MKKTKIKAGIAVIVVLSVVSLLIPFFTSLQSLESFRIVFGSVYVLFLPGFIMSYIFFPSKNENNSESEKIDSIERIALSFALSIAVVPLAVFYLNLIGIKINLLNSFLTILGIIFISMGIIFFRKH